MGKKIPPNLAKEIQKRDNYVCQYCGKDGLESALAWHQTTVDHFNPYLEEAQRNDRSNLKTACEYCNSLKRKRRFETMEDAKAYLAKRKKELQEDFLKLKKEVRGHENP